MCGGSAKSRCRPSTQNGERFWPSASRPPRATIAARGGLEAIGQHRSPFWVDGKQRLFAEPPHMQASMLLLPGDAQVPAVGDVVDARVRYTATAFDRVNVT